MEGFTLVDAGVAGIIVLSAILAYSRGFVREGMAILGWIAAAVVAYMFAPKAVPLVKEIPAVGKFLENCELSLIAGFAAVFAVGLIIAALFTPLFSSVVQRSVLGGLDQGLGFLFGVVRGVLLVGIAFLVYDRAVAANTVPMVDNSRSAKIFASFQGDINSAVPTDAPNWVVARYNELTATCARETTVTPQIAPTTAPETAPSN